MNAKNKNLSCQICGEKFQTKNLLIIHRANHDRPERNNPSTSTGARPKETPRRSTRVKKNTETEVVTMSVKSKTKNVENKNPKKLRTTPPLVDIAESEEDESVPTPLNTSALSEDTCWRIMKDLQTKITTEIGNQLSKTRKEIVNQVTKNLCEELMQRWIEASYREVQRAEVREILAELRAKESNVQPRDPAAGPSRESNVQPKDPAAGLSRETCDGEMSSDIGQDKDKNPIPESDDGEDESEEEKLVIYAVTPEDHPLHTCAKSERENEEE